MCYVHGFCAILDTENHILLDIKILRSYKSIHGENLDIGLGNHLNPKRSSKCTVFMTGSFLLKCFLYVGGNGKFQVLFGDVSEKNHCEAKNVSAM